MNSKTSSAPRASADGSAPPANAQPETACAESASNRNPGREAAAPPQNARSRGCRATRRQPTRSALRALIYSATGLSDQEFSAQTEKLRRVASYDGETRSWYGAVLGARRRGLRRRGAAV